MKHVRIINSTRNSVLGTAVRVADSWWARTRGYLGRKAPAAGEGILLSPCRGLHMMGMSFALDAIFVGRSGVVVAVHRAMQPGSRTPLYSEAEYAIELPVGTIDASGTQERDIVAWTPAEADALRPELTNGHHSNRAPARG